MQMLVVHALKADKAHGVHMETIICLYTSNQPEVGIL